jgi:capsular exopolysaccharide synthesis family protein
MNHNQEIEEDEIDIRQLFSILKDNIKTILFITFIVTLLAAAYAYFTPPVYSSSVTIAFPDDKTSKLSAIIPSELQALSGGSTESELETVKLTIQTRNFINLVLNELDISQHYFLEKNYKKVEVYKFDAFDIKLKIHDELFQEKKKSTLYDTLFEIQPIDEKHYLLKNSTLEYAKVQPYNKTIHEAFFSILVKRKALPTEAHYFVSKSDETLLADKVLENMQVSILSDNVMKISYNDPVPRRAKEVVEKIGEKLIEYKLEQKRKELSKTALFLEQQIQDMKLQLNLQGESLKKYQEKSETFLPKESSKELFEIVHKKEEELKALQLQFNEIRNFKLALDSDQLNTVSLLNSGIDIRSIQTLIEQFRKDNLAINDLRLQSTNIEKAITDNPQLTRLITMLNEKKELLAKLNFNFTPEHPQVLQASSEVEMLQDKIRSYIETNIRRLEESQALTKEKILNNIITTEKNIKAKLDVLKKDFQEKKSLLHSLPKKDLDIQSLKRQFGLSEKTYTFLLQKKIEIELSKASTVAHTRIIEDAIVPLKPSKPNKKLIVIVGFIVGLILGIFYSFLRTMLDTKIRTVATVKELTDTPIYGILPDLKNKRFFLEALRSIRTNLQFVLPNDKECVNLLLSSSVAGEGKTTVIAGLATIVAETNKKVLLMDLDLRKPRLYKEIKKSNKKGMSNYLTSNLTIEECIQNVQDNLDFFPAGSVPPNPSELLMSKKFETVLFELMKKYDYIFFDTPPIGSVIDANLLLKYADIVLLVVRADMAHKVYLENFNHLREEKGIKSAGIILNDVKLSKDKNSGQGYGYGYGYDYGYGYEPEL